MRASLVVLFIAAAAGPVRADTALVVLGPVPTGPGATAQVGAVHKAVAAAVAPPAAKTIDAACAIDPECLARAGTELGARRVLAVSLADRDAKNVTLQAVLIDVSSKEILARRDDTFAVRKVAAATGPALKRFLADGPDERAKSLFAEGNQHFNLGEFELALSFYTRAYRIRPLPGFLFNIAQCHRKLAHYQDAVTAYQSFLATHPDASNRSLVESLIVEAQDKLVEEQKLTLAKAAEDGRREAERLAAEKQRAADDRKAKEAEARAATERRKAEEARIQAELEKTYNRHPARKWTIAAGALGAGALITGGVFGLRARSSQADFHDAGCGDPSVLISADVFASCVDARDRGQHAALLANVFLIGGGAVVATSALVFVIDPGNRERPNGPVVAVSPRSIGLVVRW